MNEYQRFEGLTKKGEWRKLIEEFLEVFFEEAKDLHGLSPLDWLTRRFAAR